LPLEVNWPAQHVCTAQSLEWMTNCYRVEGANNEVAWCRETERCIYGTQPCCLKEWGINWAMLVLSRSTRNPLGAPVAGCLGLKMGLEFWDSVYFREMSARETTAAVNSILVYCFTKFMFSGWEGTGREVCSSLYRHVSFCR
jgi:hypothetical protein